MRPWLAVVPALLLTLGHDAPLAARAGVGRAGTAERDAGEIEPFVAQYCYGCHNATKAKAGLNLKRFETPDPVAADPNTWEKVAAKIRTGEMPPEDEERPSTARAAAVSGVIEAALARADAAAPPEAGRVTIRRLNRAEYNNTIRDLLALDLQPADEFPQDDAGYGFDNIGDVLSVPPLLAERYMVAAERIARTAVFGSRGLKPTLARCAPRARSIVASPVVPAVYDETGLALPNAVHAVRRLPAAGTYRVRVYTGGSRPAGSEAVRLALWLDGARIAEQSLDPTVEAGFTTDHQDFSGKMREFTVALPAGEHWIAATIPSMFEGLPPSAGGPRPSTRQEPPRPVFTPPADASPEVVEKRRKQFEADHPWPPPVNDVRIAYFELAGPYDVDERPSLETRRRLYACGHLDGRHAASCPRAIVRSLVRRAYRRPVESVDLAPLLSLFEGTRAAGGSFDEALATALHAVLVSPDFLFRVEGPQASRRTGVPPDVPARVRQDPGDGPQASALVPLTDHELATRLSYFLWSSMPDRRLRRLADEGRLRVPAVLEAEVRRMLRDPKAAALSTEFAGQWLQVRALESVAPDRDRFPAFDDYLRLSMRRETELFVGRIVAEDRSILEFLDASWTMANERLAAHYGMRGVRGPQFREVPLGGQPRAGVLTQASVLTVSSYATRTSPVLRGKWILENLLDAAPPPPPPGVPPLEERRADVPATLRQRLEAHRANPTCASCHRRMDPLGFGLEHFDAIGAWRDTDEGAAIDAEGRLPDGRTFHDAAGLQSILSAERDAFAKALASKLLTWALGRGLEPSDRRLVRSIARDLPRDGYRFSALVLAIVRSPAFQMRRGFSS